MASKAAGGKNKKQGRMKVWCKNYATRQQRERNKTRRLIRHLKVHGGDMVAEASLKALPKFNKL